MADLEKRNCRDVKSNVTVEHHGLLLKFGVLRARASYQLWGPWVPNGKVFAFEGTASVGEISEHVPLETRRPMVALRSGVSGLFSIIASKSACAIEKGTRPHALLELWLCV